MQNDAVKLPISSEPVATRPMLRSHPIEVDPYQDLFEPAPPRPAPGALAALRPASRLLQLRMPTDVPRMDADRVARLRSLLRPGDILLTTDNAFPLLQAATYLTLGSNYTHSLVYEGDGKVLEVSVGGLGGEGVIRTSLEDRIGKRMLVEAIRPPYRSEKDRNAMVAFCRARIGAPYDYTFNLDNNRAYYCTELLYKALAAIPNPIQVPFVRVAGRVIAGLEDFKRVPGARVIYSDRSNFWKNAAHRYPVAVGAAAVTAAVMATAGAERAGLGALAGSVAATLVGHEASRRVDRAFSSRDAVGAAGRRAPTRVPAGLQAARAQSAPAADLEPEPSAPAADPEPEPSAPAADLEPEPSAPAADLEPEPSAAPWQAHQRPTRLLKRGADGSYRLGDVRWGLRTDESGRGYLGDFRDTTVDPRRVQDVFFVLEPFPPERVASHALLYFSFSEPGAVRTRGRDDAEGLVVSVEVRLREGEKFDMQRGLHGGFPVIYQVGTWRDTVEKACLVKQHRLMRYRLALTGPEKEAMLRNALEEAVRARDDERYHTFVNNCNLGALRLINAGLPPARRVPERLLAIPLESPMAFVPTLLPDHLDAHGLIDGPRTVTLPQSTTASESTEGSHYGWPFRFLGGASGALGGGLAARAWHLSPPLGLALTVAAGLTGRRLGQAAQRAGTYGEEPAARWMDRPMVESATEVPRDTPGSVVVP